MTPYKIKVNIVHPNCCQQLYRNVCYVNRERFYTLLHLVSTLYYANIIVYVMVLAFRLLNDFTTWVHKRQCRKRSLSVIKVNKLMECGQLPLFKNQQTKARLIHIVISS